jgi:hypothetical protein
MMDVEETTTTDTIDTRETTGALPMTTTGNTDKREREWRREARVGGGKGRMCEGYFLTLHR